MNSRDPQPNPFGYTFHTGEHLGGEPTPYTNGGPPLLSEVEENFIGDFFQHTDPNAEPFLFDTPQFSASADSKDGFESINWNYVPPATIHRVSTTIPDQAQLHHGFNFDQGYIPEPLSAGHLGNTQDDLQAASTLFTNAQASYANGRAHSFHSLPSVTTGPNTPSTLGLHSNMPMVTTPHGLITEQMAALLPNHSNNESIDSHIAAGYASSQAQRNHEAQLAELERQRPVLKRSYTYGTDNAFNSNGFVGSSSNVSDDATAQRLLIDLHRPQPFTRHSAPDSEDVKPFPINLVRIPSDDEGQSDGATSDEDDHDRPSKKRRRAKKSTSTKIEKPDGSGRKNSSAARGGKNRKASLDDDVGRKKRLSSAGQKAQRENLTDEQKRSNHILSEQKRRNLIRQGFDDLHDLVPEIRTGGLSKSSVLNEAANFLDMLIEENTKFMALAEDANG